MSGPADAHTREQKQRQPLRRLRTTRDAEKQFSVEKVVKSRRSVCVWVCVTTFGCERRENEVENGGNSSSGCYNISSSSSISISANACLGPTHELLCFLSSSLSPFFPFLLPPLFSLYVLLAVHWLQSSRTACFLSFLFYYVPCFAFREGIRVMMIL